MIRRTFSRRSFFGLLGAAPLAVPAALRAASEPAAGAGLQTGQVVTTTFRGWQEVVAQIRAEEAAAVVLRIGPTARRLALGLSCLEHAEVSSGLPEAS